MNPIRKIKILLLLLVFTSLGFIAAAQSVSGNVVDEEGIVLQGATIQVKGTARGATTDAAGNFTIEASDGETLIVSYIGLETLEIPVGNDSNYNLVMRTDAAALSEIIVTTTRQPVRKLETTTAVTVINSQLLQGVRPEGFSEAVQGTPGMYTSQSQGRFRGAIITRGFPDGSGNGLVYTGILLDGLPTLATTARPPDFAFGMDGNVERIEVVRGSAATLFGRASAAGVVNIISKVGGTKTKGSVQLTRYNNNVDTDGRSALDYKMDFNVNGPINDSWRYNVGGYYVNDKGFRDLGYNDRGGQLRFNIDKLGENSNLRIYGSYVNVSIQNMIDIPFKLSDNTPRDEWDIYDSYYDPVLDDIEYTAVNRDGEQETRSIQESNEEGNYARGYNFGVNFDYNLSDNLVLSNKGRYQSYDHGTKFNLGVSTTYGEGPFSQIRILIDGDGTDSDLMDELRLTYNAQGENVSHSIGGGVFYSRGNYTPQTFSLVGWTTPGKDNLALNGFVPPAFGPPTSGGQARVDEYTITSTSFFFGDEMKVGDNFRLNAGVRYDKINMDIQGLYDVPQNVQREENHSDYSFSVGTNYKLNGRSAVYGNFVSAFRMPDYSAYTAAQVGSVESKPRIEDNERVNNLEIGYRTGAGDLGIDLAGFYTKINNRLATVYEGAMAVQRPLGTNVINGFEVGLTYAPSSIKGLLIRGSATLQNATFDDFDITANDINPDGPLFGFELTDQGTDADGNRLYTTSLKGNQIPRVPSRIFNLMANYSSKHIDVNAMMNYFGKRFADATNLLQQDDITNINLGAAYKYNLSNGSKIKIGFLVKNVINTDKALRFLYVSDNDAAIKIQQDIQSGDIDPATTYYTGIPFLPRRILITIGYDF